jgi:ribose transport system substrate-binding protein
MKEWLLIFGHRTLPTFGVAAQNDAMATGAKRALEEWARSRPQFSAARVPIVGCDGTPNFGQNLVKDKQISATVIMPPTAGRAIDEVRAMLVSGNASPEAEVVLSPSSYPELRELARAGSA